jgi:hypothetical protein
MKAVLLIEDGANLSRYGRGDQINETEMMDLDI